MNPLQQALCDVVDALESADLRYFLIGGMAVSALGEVRVTADVDLTVWAPSGDEGRIADVLLASFRGRLPDAKPFALRSRVLLLQSASGVPVDVAFSSYPHEQPMFDRAITVSLAGRNVRVASPEDLIFLKLFSPRGQDDADCTRLIRRYRDTLDRAYLDPLVRSVSQALDQPDIFDNYIARVTKPRRLP